MRWQELLDGIYIEGEIISLRLPRINARPIIKAGVNGSCKNNMPHNKLNTGTSKETREVLVDPMLFINLK